MPGFGVRRDGGGRTEAEAEHRRSRRRLRKHAVWQGQNPPAMCSNSMSGQTIEVLNTDAEGRLILCDA